MAAASAPPFAARPPVYGAQYAPLASASSLMGWSGGGGGGAAHTWWSRYLRRAFSVAQWDLEYTFYQILYSFRSPAKVYKLTQHRKQTKNQWARDDPAFVCLIAAFLAVSSVAFGVAYEYPSPLTHVYLIVQSWLCFVLSGGIIATGCWTAANKYMRAPALLPHSVEQEVEWLYAWDVHCNSYVPILLLLYVGQYLALPLLMRDGALAVLAANALYAGAACHYVYITFSGYLGECAYRPSVVSSSPPRACVRRAPGATTELSIHPPTHTRSCTHTLSPSHQSYLSWQGKTSSWPPSWLSALSSSC